MDLVGKLLIAPPSVKGNFWYKTVVMVTEQHDTGSVGLVLNKRSDLTISDLGMQVGLDLDDIPGFVYIGGPISQQSLSLLHTAEWKCRNTINLTRNFSLSSADDILPRLADGDVPRKWRMFVGMCGWAPNQLLNEIVGKHPYRHETSWCISSSNYELVFSTDNKTQWSSALDHAGLEFAQNVLS